MRQRVVYQNLHPTFALVEASGLLCHEEVEPDRLRELREELERDRVLQQPLLVDGRTLVILDGHHRFACLQQLGCLLIPAYLVDYSSPVIRVASRRPGFPVSKELVVHRGLTRRPLPPRSTRHRLTRQLPAHPVALSSLSSMPPLLGVHTAQRRPILEA